MDKQQGEIKLKKLMSLVGTSLLMSAMFISASGHASAASATSRAAVGGIVSAHHSNGGSADPSPCSTCVPPPSTSKGTLVLQVVDNSGPVSQPIAGASVRIVDSNGQGVPTITSGTDSNGYFSTRLDEGAYYITVTADGYSGTTQTLKITPNQGTSSTAVLTRTGPAPCYPCGAKR